MKAIDQRTKFELKTPYILYNATEDVIALPNHYKHVQSLYKYGCGACAGKVRNKWVNICDICKAEARKDPETLKAAEALMAKTSRSWRTRLLTIIHQKMNGLAMTVVFPSRKRKI